MTYPNRAGSLTMRSSNRDDRSAKGPDRLSGCPEDHPRWHRNHRARSQAGRASEPWYVAGGWPGRTRPLSLSCAGRALEHSRHARGCHRPAAPSSRPNAEERPIRRGAGVGPDGSTAAAAIRHLVDCPQMSGAVFHAEKAVDHRSAAGLTWSARTGTARNPDHSGIEPPCPTHRAATRPGQKLHRSRPQSRRAAHTLAAVHDATEHTGGVFLPWYHLSYALLAFHTGRRDEALAEIEAGLDPGEHLATSRALRGLAAVIESTSRPADRSSSSRDRRHSSVRQGTPSRGSTSTWPCAPTPL